MIFRCKNCGGNVVYSPEKHGMYCPFCESEGSQNRQESQTGAMSLCPNCGGEIPLEEHTSAGQCPYCDSYLIFNERVEGVYAPKMMIPFQMGKEACKGLLREKFKKFRFAPADFMSEARWYVVHTYSGYENKVKANIDKTIENRHMCHTGFMTMRRAVIFRAKAQKSESGEAVIRNIQRRRFMPYLEVWISASERYLWMLQSRCRMM